MKKNLISNAIAGLMMIGAMASANARVSLDGNDIPNGALTPTTATGFAVNPNGIGHALIVPYFTTQNGNVTLLSITNTDIVNGKAVKVRFRGAANSDDIFDFQVFLSPGDVWTANVSRGADGRSQLVTTDRSCTLPANVNASFITTRLNPSATEAARAEQTREGYIEMLNMADIPERLPNGTVNQLYTAIKHVNGIAPCGNTAAGAAAFARLLPGNNPLTEQQASDIGFDTPTSGLTGGWTVLNRDGASVAWSAKATALLATAPAGAVSRGRFVFSPQTSDFVAGNLVNLLTNDALFRNPIAPLVGGVVSPRLFDLPDLSTPYLVGAVTGQTPSQQANLVSAALAVNNIVNEYLTDTSINASTDWSFSQPTRRYAVARNYQAQGEASLVFAGEVATNPPAVASDYYRRLLTPAGVPVAGGNTRLGNGNGRFADLICTFTSPEGVEGITNFDREEQTVRGFLISPGSPRLPLCGETAVLSFNAGGEAAPSVLGSTIARLDNETGYRDGWTEISTTGIGFGLPVLGHAFLRATGPVLPGGRTNFGITYEHTVR